MRRTASNPELNFYGDFGEWLRKKRLASGLSREQFGGRLGVHRNLVFRWEQGEKISAWMYVQILNTFADCKQETA